MNIREVINHDTLIDDKKKRVCAYARVSTLKDTAQNSFDTQVKTYTDFILSNPSWQFAGVYADEGKSGTNYDSRPQFKLMIEVARNKMIDLIITKSISRFARNTIDCLSILNQLKEWGTEVWFENENISSFDPKIEFVISVLSGIAEEEARNVSENVKWNVRNRFKEGKFYVVTKRFMGYTHDENGNLVIVEEEAKVVKKIFDMYTSGSSIPSIIKWLESNHIKTVLGKDKWYRGAIIGIVSTINPILMIKRNLKINIQIKQYIVVLFTALIAIIIFTSKLTINSFQ